VVVNTLFVNGHVLMLDVASEVPGEVRALAYVCGLEYDPGIVKCKASVIFFSEGLTNGRTEETFEEGRGDSSETGELFEQPQP